MIDDVLPAITVSGLSVKRGKYTVLTDIDFELPQGKVIGLIGPSGSGKTTLMRALVGVQRNVGGSISIFKEPAGSKQLRYKIGYLTQSPSVYPDITVKQNLAFFASVIGARKADIKRVLHEVDMTSHENAVASTLSGGQRARLSLSVALLGNPDLLVLDEPTVGLDPVLRQRLWNLFHALAKKGKSLIISSHVMDEAEKCDHLLLLRGGKLLADTTVNDLLRITKEPTLEQAFISLIKASEKHES